MKLNQEDFYIELWELVSFDIVSQRYLVEYEDFINSLSRDLYLQYLKGVSMDVIVNLLQIFFYNLFNSHSSARNLEEF